MARYLFLTAMTLVTLAAKGANSDERPTPGGTLQLESALVTLIDQRDIPARVEGPLIEMDVREGQLVEIGQLLGRIEDTEPRLALNRTRLELEIARRQAESDVKVRVAKKARDFTLAEYQRAVESSEKYRKAVSETELEKLRIAAERSVLDVEQSEHELDTVRLSRQLKENERDVAALAVDRHKIVSPIAGMVVQLFRRPGEWVQPGTVVARIIRIDRLRVEAFVDGSQGSVGLLGRPVRLEVGSLGKDRTAVEGAVVFVSPEINPVNGQVRLWAEVDNPRQLLRPGSRGALIVGPASEGRLKN